MFNLNSYSTHFKHWCCSYWHHTNILPGTIWKQCKRKVLTRLSFCETCYRATPLISHMYIIWLQGVKADLSCSLTFKPAAPTIISKCSATLTAGTLIFRECKLSSCWPYTLLKKQSCLEQSKHEWTDLSRITHFFSYSKCWLNLYLTYYSNSCFLFNLTHFIFLSYLNKY